MKKVIDELRVFKPIVDLELAFGLATVISYLTIGIRLNRTADVHTYLSLRVTLLMFMCVCFLAR